MQRRGTPLATIDGLIGATALEHGLIMTTRNVKDFAGLGIEILTHGKAVEGDSSAWFVGAAENLPIISVLFTAVGERE